MNVFGSASVLSALVLAAPLAAAAPVRADATSPDAPPSAYKGDWRRHEIVRTWRDGSGCRLRVISYHRPDGAVDTREDRDCGK